MNQVVAIDGGGTHTRGGLYDAQRLLLAERESGPSNPVVIGWDACIDVLANLSRDLLNGHDAQSATVACGVAGVGAAASGPDIAYALLPRINAYRVIVTNDLCPILFANAGTADAIAVIAGTGSSVTAQSADGRTTTASGLGTVIGDDGSAYQLAIAGLRAMVDALDDLAPATRLVDTLPRSVGADGLSALVTWCNASSKDAVAGLAKAVAEAAAAGDSVAVECIRIQAKRLAKRVMAAHGRLRLPGNTPVYLNGGLFENCALFREAFLSALAGIAPKAHAQLAPLRGHRAVLELAFTPSLPTHLPIASITR